MVFSDDQDRSAQVGADEPAVTEELVVDLEAHAQEGRIPPKAARYTLRVDKNYYRPPPPPGPPGGGGFLILPGRARSY